MKKPLKPRHFIIDDNVFRVKVHFWICTKEYFNKVIQNNHSIGVSDIPGSEGNFISLDSDNGTIYYLWLDSFDNTDDKLGVLNHELLHCAYSILQDRGIDINDETEEVLAYYHTYLFTEAYKKLK